MPFDPSTARPIDESKPSTGGFDPSTAVPISESKPRQVTFPTEKERTRISNEAGYAFLHGLGKTALGFPGELEYFGTYTVPEFLGFKPEHKQALGDRETVFPTMEEVGKIAKYVGIPEVSQQYAPFEQAGEIAPLVKALPSLVRGAGALSRTLGITPGVERLTSKATGAYRTARGKELADQVEKIKSSMTGMAAGQRAAAEKEIARLTKAQQQIERGAAVSEQRAKVSPIVPFKEQIDKIDSYLKDTVTALRNEEIRLGKSVEQANAEAAASVNKIAEAEQFAKDLDAQMLSKPSMSKEEFGQTLGNIVDNYVQKYEKARKLQSGYDEAVTTAGDALRINTESIKKSIQNILRVTRNPDLGRVLSFVNNALETSVKSGEKVTQQSGLSVASADSLRKFLDKISNSKMFQDMALDKETLNYIRDIRGMLVKTAGDAWPSYREALGKWRTLSRPLDIIERNAGLKKISEFDPLSQERRVAASDVVGALIRDARRGNKALSKLVAESPELKDSARLYFSRVLFGKEAAPSIAQLRTFLQTYESPLKQLGLFDEFRDLRVAKQTAKEAVDFAKDVETTAKAGVKAAETTAKTAAERTKAAESLSAKQQKRLGEVLQTAQTSADIAAKARATRLEKAATDVAKAKGKAQKARVVYGMLEKELSQPGMTAEQTVSKVTSFAKDLAKDEIITLEQYNEILNQVGQISKQIADKNEAAREIGRYARKIGYAVGGVALEEVIRRNL